MTLTDTTLEEHLDATLDERLESYKAFLRIPSISGAVSYTHLTLPTIYSV